MNDSAILLKLLQDEGLSQEEAEQSILAIAEWVDANYPVMGVLLKNWLKQNKLPIPEYNTLMLYQ